MDPNPDPECMDPYHYGNLYLHPQLHQLKIRIHPHQGSKLDPEPDGVGEYSPTQWFTPMTDRGWGKRHHRPDIPPSGSVSRWFSVPVLVTPH
jgi:hypothetical protein